MRKSILANKPNKKIFFTVTNAIFSPTFSSTMIPRLFAFGMGLGNSCLNQAFSNVFILPTTKQARKQLETLGGAKSFLRGDQIF